MAKIKVPLFSFSAHGSLGRALSVRRRDRGHVAESKPIPKDAKTSEQLAWRTLYQQCTALWHTLSESEQKAWHSAAIPFHMPGYSYFMSSCLRPNPGIYLPLAGGTMQGQINMDSNKIITLPTPSADHEPATKGYVDAAIATLSFSAIILDVINKSGEILYEGDVVIWDQYHDDSILKSTSLNDYAVAGAVHIGGGDGESIKIITHGYAPKVLTTAAEGVGRGYYLLTSGTDKHADLRASESDGNFAIALSNADASGYLSALICLAAENY